MKKKKPFYKKSWVIILSAILFVAFIRFNGFLNVSGESKNSLKVVELDFYRHDTDILHISGKITNTMSKNLSGIKVEISLYNSEGSVVGTASDYLRDLAPNETWEFDAHKLIEEDVDRIEISKITVF